MWRGKRWIKIKEADREKQVNYWNERVKKWGNQVGLKDENGKTYITNEFITKESHLYRYIYLSEDEIKSLTFSYSARPKVELLTQVCRNE